MSETAKRQISEKVVVTVISAIILAALAYFGRNYLLPALEVTWNGLKKAFAWFLTGTVNSPAWLFCVLAAVSVILFLILLLLAVDKILSSMKVSAPNWRNYDTDMFFGMKWRWLYTNSDQIGDMWCFCPDDKTALVYRDDSVLTERSTMSYSSAVSFRCETCNRNFGPFIGDKDNFRDQVKRQIARKIDTNEWQAAAPLAAHQI